MTARHSNLRPAGPVIPPGPAPKSEPLPTAPARRRWGSLADALALILALVDLGIVILVLVLIAAEHGGTVSDLALAYAWWLLAGPAAVIAPLLSVPIAFLARGLPRAFRWVLVALSILPALMWLGSRAM